ncbi:MAG TPA: aldo/keto reductase [Myxococcota bacterium]|nr:aldo/keto reductase [Myxococcota bacterium]
MRTRTALLLAFAFALLVGFGITGAVAYKSFIGLDPSAFPGGEAIQAFARRWNPGLDTTAAGGVLLLASLLGVGALAFLLVRGARASSVDPERRRFLTGAGAGAGAALGSMAVAGAAGAARALFGVGEGNGGWGAVGSQIFDRNLTFTNPEWKDAWKGSRIAAHRRFGRTGWDVSDIVLGTGRIEGENGEKIARLALDRGVNYFDTSPDYAGSGSEQAMGRAIQGVRDKLFIATKFCSPTGHLPPGTPVARYIEVIEESMRRLGTDYVDLCHIHSVDEVARLMDENAHEAFDRLKQQGKARFLGFSTHTPNLVQVVSRAIDSGRFDVMMLAYHHGIWPQVPELIARARKEQDMGVVAMKTLKGAKHRGLENFQPYADSYAQAALKWTLSNPDVSCAVISFFELQHVDEYLSASGRPLSPKDLAILEAYDRQIAGSYCGPHCGQCLSSCPEDLPIHDVLRQRMYFEDYGWEKEGMRLYSQLGKKADVCASCSAPCAGSCPVGIPIRERMLGAHDLLTLS